MPEYLVDVHQNLHPEEIDAYVNRVKAAMAQLESRQASAGGAVSPGLRAEAQVTQARAYATVEASKNTLGPEGAIRLRAELDEAVKSLATSLKAAGSSLLNKTDLQRNASRIAAYETGGRGLGSADEQIAEAAAQREATRLTKQRVAEEALRLEAVERGIIFTGEENTAEREAAVRVARRAAAEEVRYQAAQRALSAESGISEQIAQRKVLERELNEQVAARVRQIERERAQDRGPASPFQRAQAYFYNRNRPESQQKEENSFATGGQFISQRLFSGGAYAIAGTALYSMVGNVKALVAEGEKTQVMFSQLRAQLEDVGQADKFPEVRDHILDAAHAAGVAADQVGALESTMLGAFNTPREAMEATNAGLALMQVSGLQLADVQNNLVAVMRTFGITGAEAMNKVDDQVNHLHDTFGVAQREIIDGVGNIAPLAEEMGLSFKEASTLIAGASAVSGRSATQTANEIGRALTQIEKQLPIITNALNQPRSKGLLEAVTGDVAQGKTGQVLIDLIRHWRELSKAQQDTILTAIGGRREFASLAAALGENRKIIAALDDQSDHSGVTANRLAEYHRSLAFQLKSSGEAFKQLGVAIINSPLGQALAYIVQAGGDVSRWIGDFLGLLGKLNDLLGGVPGRVIALTGAWLILKNVLSLEHLKQAVTLLRQIFTTNAGRLTGATADKSAATHSAAITEGGEAAAGVMRAGVVEGGEAAAAAMATALKEASAGWALETRAVTQEEIAEINTTLATTFSAGAAELAAAEEAVIAELTAELSLLNGTLVESAAAQTAAAELQLEAAAAQTAAATEQAASSAANVAAGAENLGGAAAGAAGIGGRLAGAAEAGGAMGRLAGGVGAALGPLASFAGLLEAALPILAVVVGFKVGGALGRAVEDVAGPKGPHDITLHRKLFSPELTDDTKKKLDDYYGAVNKRLLEQGKREDVQKIADQSLPDRSVLEKITLGGDPKTQQKREQVKQARKDLGAQLGLGGNQQYNQDIINALESSGAITGDTAAELAEGISKNDYESYKKVTELYNKRKKGHPKFTNALAEARRESPAITGEAVKKAQDLQKQFEAGQITFDELQAGLNSQLDIYKEMAAKAGGEQNLPQQVQDQMNQLAEQVDKNARDRAEALLRAQDAREQADAARQGRPAQIAAALAKAQRDAAQAQKYDDPEKAAAAYAEQQKAEQDQVDYDSAKRKSDADLRRARANANYDPVGAAQADLDNANEDLAQAKDDAARQEARANIVEKTFALQQAKDAVDKTRRDGHAALLRAQAEARFDPVAAAQADLDLAVADYNANRDPAQRDALMANIISKRFALQQAADQQAQQARANHAQLLQAQAQSRYDPVAAAQAELDAAQGDLDANRDPRQVEALQARVIAARNALIQSQVDQAHAISELQQDIDKGNAQQVAADAIAAATADVNRIVAAGGYGTSAWAEAQRALIDAQRAAVDAALASTNAILDYDEAVANAAGDSVRAAQDEYQKAVNAYNAALQKNDTDAARAAQTDLVTKAANVRREQISTGERNIDFQLQMQQISTQQAIAMYEGMLALAQGNEQWTQELLLKINQLRKEAASNLQFDIPQDININGLLYQARRLDQMSAAGLGYQDNRNINVQYNVYTPMDHQQTMNDLAGALSGSPRTGSAPRTYP